MTNSIKRGYYYFLKDKSISKREKFNVLGTDLIHSLGLLIITMTFLYLVVYNTNIGQSAIKNFAFEGMSKTMENDDYITFIAKLCENHNDDYWKVYCVNNVVKSLFFYNESRTSIFKTPESTLFNGGVCRDTILIYSNVLTKLNIKYTFETTDDHVFVIAKFNKDNPMRYCILDMDVMECY